MKYIIFDLEWNNAYNYVIKGFMNDIIEIGAVKLDENLNIIDTFKQLVKPMGFKKLSTRCKNLTNITNEEIIDYGIPFDSAISELARWSSDDVNTFLSWSNSDLYVLLGNLRTYMNTINVDFIDNYCDAQQYCMSFIDREDNNQISLAKCADIMDIDVDLEKLHRALADCYVTAECFKKVFDKDKLAKYTKSCDNAFFERLLYKPYYITQKKSDLFNLDDVVIRCPACSGVAKMVSEFESVNKTFRGPIKCTECNRAFWAYVRAKKTYDDVIVTTNVVAMNKKRARKFKNQ